MPSLIFFLSGASTLVFETLFFHVAGLVMGNSVSATVVVLTTFMGGMAAGNGLSVRYGARIRHPARVYALLETVIACSGAGLIIAFFTGAGLLAPIFTATAAHPALLPMRALIVFMVQIIPATAMGATLPVMVKAAHREGGAFGGTLGRLYGWNTLGAVCGVLTGEILLVRWFGIVGAALLAALISLAAAALALRLHRGSLDAGLAEPRPVSSGPGPGVPRQALLLLACAFTTGLSLMALEVVWLRFLLLFFYPTSMNFAILLAVVLTGIGAGSLFAANRLRRAPEFQSLLVPAVVLAGTFVILCYRFFLPSLLVASLLGRAASIAAVFLVLPACLLSGAVFTMLGQALHRVIGREIETAGWLTMANTLGAAAGPILARFVLLPGLGIERSFLALALTYGGVALLLLTVTGLRPVPGRTDRRAWFFAIFLLVIVLFPLGSLNRFLDLSISSFTPWGERRVDYRETPIDSIQILRKDLEGEPYFHRMVTNSYSMSTTSLRGKRYMKLFVYLPVALRPDPERALLLGYGCGNTAQALADTRSLKSIDIVDISAAALATSPLIHPGPREDPLEDPRVKVHVEDARFFLLSTRRTFDLITGEPPPPKASKVVNLYTREFFGLVRDRLSPGGAATYWLPVDQLLVSETRAIVRGFCDTFEDCSLWAGSEDQWIMFGTRAPAPPVSEAEFGRQWGDPAVGPEMQALGFAASAQFGSLYIADGRRLRDWLGENPALTDANPSRLTPWGPPSESDLRAYRELSDPERSREDFLSGRGISARWPPALRDGSGEHFPVREIVNRLLGRLDASLLRSCLTDPRLGGYLLWAFGSDRYAQRILSEKVTAGSESPAPDIERYLHLAARAAEGKDFAGAADHLRRAEEVQTPATSKRRFSSIQLREMQEILRQAAAGLAGQ